MSMDNREGTIREVITINRGSMGVHKCSKVGKWEEIMEEAIHNKDISNKETILSNKEAILSNKETILSNRETILSNKEVISKAVINNKAT